MCGDKLNQAQAAGQAFLDAMALPPDQASIVSFAGSGNLHAGLTTNRTQASNALSNIVCGGISRIDAGLTRAFDEMTGPRRVAGPHAGRHPAHRRQPGGRIRRRRPRRQRKACAKPVSNCSRWGWALDVNAALLREIATAPDHYYQSPAPADLAQIYSRLAGELRMAPAFNVNLTDLVASQFEIVPGSFSGAATPQVSGQTTGVEHCQVGRGRYRGQPSACSRCNAAPSRSIEPASASYDDNRGYRHTVAFPAPTVTVTGCDGGNSDVFIRDNQSDTGVVASKSTLVRLTGYLGAS